MGVQVNQEWLIAARETRKRLEIELADAIQAAFPEFDRARAEKARDDACDWMGRDLCVPN